MIDILSWSFTAKLIFGTVSLIVAAVLILVYRLVISPWTNMKFYQKQGMKGKFSLIDGHYDDYGTYGESFKNHGDVLHYYKNAARTDPQRGYCYNCNSDVLLVVVDPVLVKGFLLNQDCYQKDPPFFEFFGEVLGQGLITADGNQWKSRRKALSTLFHFESLKSHIPVVQKSIHNSLYELRNEPLKELDIQGVFQTITGGVIANIFFGEQINGVKLEGKSLPLNLDHLLCEAAAMNGCPEAVVFGPWFVKKAMFPRYRKFIKKVKAFRDTCQQIIDKRKAYYEANPESKKGMLELIRDCDIDGKKMTEKEIVDEFATFVLAGMDTAGHVLAMSVYFLQLYPEMKEKMLSEVKQYYKMGETTTYEELNKLDYTLAFLKEVMRMMTPATGVFPRRAIKTHQIGDLVVKKGTIFSLEHAYNNFNEEFFKEPHKFDPERFLEKDTTRDAYAYIPFSAGPRNCVGQHLALIEMKIILAEFLLMYDFELKKDYQLRMTFRFLYGPYDPLVVNLTEKAL